MSFGSFAEDDEVMSEINMTPLVDVMLVLLIIFMITMPVIHHSVQMNLPQATNQAADLHPPHINLSILANGNILWNNEKVPFEQLESKISEASTQQPQPELHLYADGQTAYERVAKIMALAQSNGLSKIGFITDPVHAQAK